MNTPLSFSEKLLWGKRLLIVDSWCDGSEPILHGFFCSDLNVKPGLEEFNALSTSNSGPTLLKLQQVHGADLIELRTNATAAFSTILLKDGQETADQIPPECLKANTIVGDGWIADLSLLSRLNLALGIVTADCVPLLGLCRSNGLIFALHCGWRSTVADILPYALSRLENRGCDLSSIEIAIGPGASLESYEIGEEVYDQIMSTISRAIIRYPRKLRLDNSNIIKKEGRRFWAGISQLLFFQAWTMGVRRENIARFTGCTIRDPKYFSYRRDGESAGRQLSLIGPPSTGSNIWQSLNSERRS